MIIPPYSILNTFADPVNQFFRNISSSLSQLVSSSVRASRSRMAAFCGESVFAAIVVLHSRFSFRMTLLSIREFQFLQFRGRRKCPQSAFHTFRCFTFIHPISLIRSASVSSGSTGTQWPSTQVAGRISRILSASFLHSSGLFTPVVKSLQVQSPRNRVLSCSA